MNFHAPYLIVGVTTLKLSHDILLHLDPYIDLSKIGLSECIAPVGILSERSFPSVKVCVVSVL